MDPYIYPNTNTLINKLDIRDEQQLIDVEAQLLIAGIVDISSIIPKIDFHKCGSIQIIHQFLFQELYLYLASRKCMIWQLKMQLLANIHFTD